MGQILSISGNSFLPAVHPHVCGADSSRTFLSVSILRFTPTCVGQMQELELVYDDNIGSPPRVWGRCHQCFCKALFARFTPTCVGQMLHSRAKICLLRFTPTCVGQISKFGSSLRSNSVHPHVCGADDVENKERKAESRFTPTCVGQILSLHF